MTMLAGGTDQVYRRALAAGYEPYTRVEVWFGGRQKIVPRRWRGDGPGSGLTFLPGSAVSANLSSPVARSLTLMVPLDLYPETDTDLLNTNGTELRVFQGAVIGSTKKYIWPTFRGKIQDVSEEETFGTCIVSCDDRAQDVLDSGFRRPQNSQPGDDIDSEFRRLITGAVADAEFGASDEFAQKVAALSWEFDRASAIEEMVKSAGGLWYPLADGSYVARTLPWTRPGPPVVNLTEAQHGGVILSARRSTSRRRQFNVVVVTGERLNGDVPVVAVASDDDPSSPTWVGGPFGMKVKLVRLHTPYTQGGALATAKKLLRSYTTPTQSWGWDQVPDASAELGDITSVTARSRTAIQVLQSFSLPLGTGTMSVQGVSQVVGQVEEGVG